MLADLGSMRVEAQSASRIELGMGRGSAVAGWVATALAVVAAFVVVPFSRWLAGLACAAAGLGWFVASARHRLVFDKDDGVLRVERRVAGLATRTVVPLFHLRAVVVRSRGAGRGFVAVVERRNGSSIVIDTRERAAPLYELVRAIADVTDLRLVYDTTAAS